MEEQSRSVGMLAMSREFHILKSSVCSLNIHNDTQEGILILKKETPKKLWKSSKQVADAENTHIMCAVVFYNKSLYIVDIVGFLP